MTAAYTKYVQIYLWKCQHTAIQLLDEEQVNQEELVSQINKIKKKQLLYSALITDHSYKKFFTIPPFDYLNSFIHEDFGTCMVKHEFMYDYWKDSAHYLRLDQLNLLKNLTRLSDAFTDANPVFENDRILAMDEAGKHKFLTNLVKQLKETQCSR